MARLVQSSVIVGSKKNILADIEALKPESPSHRWVNIKVRYFFDERLMLEIESAITEPLAKMPLAWLESSVKTKHKAQSQSFSDFDSPHVVVINQRRLYKSDLLDIQKEMDVDAYPYPFMYDVSLLVNNDSEVIPFCGLGMYVGGLSYHEVYEFLTQLHAEVKAAWD